MPALLPALPVDCGVVLMCRAEVDVFTGFSSLLHVLELSGLSCSLSTSLGSSDLGGVGRGGRGVGGGVRLLRGDELAPLLAALDGLAHTCVVGLGFVSRGGVAVSLAAKVWLLAPTMAPVYDNAPGFAVAVLELTELIGAPGALGARFSLLCVVMGCVCVRVGGLAGVCCLAGVRAGAGALVTTPVLVVGPTRLVTGTLLV